MVGQGIFLDAIYRNQLYTAWKSGKDWQVAHSEVFMANPAICARKSTANLFNWFATEDQPVIDAYLHADNTRKEHAGRKRKYSEIHDAEILKIVCGETRKRLHQINTEFYKTFEDELEAIPADSTICRHLKALKKHRKRLNRTNVRKDVSKQLAYLRDVSFVPSKNLVDMDGIHFNPKDYLEKYGWATIGKEAYALQVIIRGKTFAVHAAVCKDGFLAWQVYECHVTSAEVCKFISNNLAQVFPANAFLILDNASNQKHASVQMAMEGYLKGRYFYCSPYSPELKPIERAFSMVRSWIRNHENDPAESRDLIQQAFQLYSVEGERGYHCHNLFRLYDENYKLFLADLV